MQLQLLKNSSVEKKDKATSISLTFPHLILYRELIVRLRRMKSHIRFAKSLSSLRRMIPDPTIARE